MYTTRLWKQASAVVVDLIADLLFIFSLSKAFPKSEGWPFPEYIGACGRVVVEEYVGRELSSYIDAPFEIRVR